MMSVDEALELLSKFSDAKEIIDRESGWERDTYQLLCDQEVFDAIEVATEALKEPKVIHCRDCDFWTKQKDSLQGRCALTGTYPTGSWFCGNAKRKANHEYKR